MVKEDLIIRNIYAFYGRAMFTAQMVEKALMYTVILKYLESNYSETRHNELIFEKLKLTTGQLIREVKELNIFQKNIDLFSNCLNLKIINIKY